MGNSNISSEPGTCFRMFKMYKHFFTIVMVFMLAVLIGRAKAGQLSDFASVLVSYQGPFGAPPHNDPNAVLGPPSTAIYDSWEDEIYTVSMVYPAWNVTPQGDPTVLALGPGSEVVVGFDHKVADNINNPYGIDFIVFSNTFFQRQGFDLTPDTDMAEVYLTSPASINDKWITVSVAQDPNGPWYTFPEGITAGSLYPTNPFAWDSDTQAWAQPQDFLTPVDPDLTLADFSGKSVPQAIALYNGSAGGAGFDLQWLDPDDFQSLRIDPASGRRWIKYVKLTSDESGVVDAVADVAACGDYKHPFPPGDLNFDCRVDLADFAIMAENWMVCTWKCEP